MSELRLVVLDEVLTAAQMTRLQRQLEDLGADEVPEPRDDTQLEEPVNDDHLTDFMDRLGAQDMACELYIPVEFDGQLEVGGRTVGSSFALLEVLDDLRDELEIDEEADDEDDEELDMDLIEEQLRAVWRLFLKVANSSVERQVALRVVS